MAVQRRFVAATWLVALLSIGVLAGMAWGSSPTTTSLNAYDVTLTPNWISPSDPRVVQLPGGVALPVVADDAVPLAGQLPAAEPLPAARPARHRRRRSARLGRLVVHHPALLARRATLVEPRDRGAGRSTSTTSPATRARNGGVGWGFGSGVSSLALDWLPGAPSPQIASNRTRPTRTTRCRCQPRRLAHVRRALHRRPHRRQHRARGSVTVWADGSDTPAISLNNVNTVQRAKGPDGNWYTQRWMQLWEGDYTGGLPVKSTVRLALTRIGTTHERSARRPADRQQHELAGSVLQRQRNRSRRSLGHAGDPR